MYTLIKKS